jgi:futalosine hydrolase
MEVLIAVPTQKEIEPFIKQLKGGFIEHKPNCFTQGALSIEVLISGVGCVLTTYHLSKRIFSRKPDLAILAGIGGSFNSNFQIGQVVHVISERFGDMGAETQDGQLLDLYDLGLSKPGSFPFDGQLLVNKQASGYEFLPLVSGLTVNKVHGSSNSIVNVKQKYNTDIENMEGAAFFYVCLLENVPFLEIRAISNYVEVRNRTNWDIDLATRNLSISLIEIIELLS